MKQVTKAKIFLFILIILGLIMTRVNAASVSIKAEPDTTAILTNNIAYVNLSLTDFSDIEESDTMAVSGSIDYDKTIFKNVEMEALNGWVCEFNNENGKFVADTGSASENQIIARFKLTIEDNVSVFNTQVKFNNISITNNDNLDVNNLKLTVNIRTSSDSQDNNDDQQNTSNDNNQQTPSEDTSTDEPAEVPDNNNDNNNDEINQSENNNEDKNEQETPNKPQNTNETTTDGVKEPEANSIGQVGDLTVAKDPIPQTGVSYIVLGVIALVVVVGTIAFLRYKNMYN